MNDDSIPKLKTNKRRLALSVCAFAVAAILLAVSMMPGITTNVSASMTTPVYADEFLERIVFSGVKDHEQRSVEFTKANSFGESYQIDAGTPITSVIIRAACLKTSPPSSDLYGVSITITKDGSQIVNIPVDHESWNYNIGTQYDRWQYFEFQAPLSFTITEGSNYVISSTLYKYE